MRRLLPLLLAISVCAGCMKQFRELAPHTANPRLRTTSYVLTPACSKASLAQVEHNLYDLSGVRKVRLVKTEPVTRPEGGTVTAETLEVTHEYGEPGIECIRSSIEAAGYRAVESDAGNEIGRPSTPAGRRTTTP